MAIEIPERLRTLLGGGRHETTTLAFVEAIGTILADNKTPFFPDYTDHGTEHVESVLDAAVTLIPDAAWTLLTAEDAAALTAAVCLHDIGMHVREGGFRELVTAGSRFRAVAWFAERQRRRPPDQAWHDLWESFRREARQWTQSDLDRLLGLGHGGTPAIAFGDHDTRPERWVTADRLVVGEFLRRHHARLAHEIAFHGFPGVEQARLPALAGRSRALADAAGAIARSHGESLRIGLAYAAYRHARTKQPWGVYAGYLMALLRIADYFQLDVPRAPALLLHLKQPQSPVSVNEWCKHSAVDRLSWNNDDPRAIYVQANADHGLRTHLQLTDLLDGLQRELDTTTAVLSETYNAGDVVELELSAQRVTTNLFDPGIHDELPYVPRRARLRSAEDLFRLVIRDLYGDRPAVAGRELVQNAVDAVRERRLWEERHGTLPEGGLHALGGGVDVLVEVDCDDGRNGVLRVTDRGVGMTAETLIDHFMSAGASFRPSAVNAERTDAVSIARTMKAGRFGVGAFAAFLLGEVVNVTTRHVTSDRGVRAELRMDAELIEVRWTEQVPVGTTIEVPFALGPSPPWERRQPAAKLAADIAGCYRLDDPKLVVLLGGQDADPNELPRPPIVPSPGEPLPDAWRELKRSGFEAVHWSVDVRRSPVTQAQPLVHNGIVIGAPGAATAERMNWSTEPLSRLMAAPPLAVFDGRGALGLTLTRYALAEPWLPFEQELVRSIGRDVVAHALVRGPRPYPLRGEVGFIPIYSQDSWWPTCAVELGERPLFVVADVDYQADGTTMAFVQGHDEWDDWERFPLRTTHALEAWALHSDAQNTEHLAELVELLGGALCRTAVGVASTIDSFVPAADSFASFALVFERSIGSTLIGHSPDAPPDYAAESAVTDLLRDLRKLDEMIVAVAAFQPPSIGGERDPIAEIWEQYVGRSGMPRNEEKRRALRQRITAADPEIADLASRWERLAAARKA